MSKRKRSVILISFILTLITLIWIAFSDTPISVRMLFSFLIAFPIASLQLSAFLNLTGKTSLYWFDAILGLLWINPFNLLDFLVSLNIIAFLSLLRIVLAIIRPSIFRKTLHFLLVIPFAIPVLLYFAFYLRYGKIMTNIEYLALLQTNKQEALEFLGTISPATYIYLLVAISLLVFLFYKSVSCKQNFCVATAFSAKKIMCLLVDLCVMVFILGKIILPCSYMLKPFFEAKDYFDSLHKYSVSKEQALNDLRLIKSYPPNKETIVLVIGESANRDYMHVYKSENVYNTPWQSSEASKGNLLIFDNAYACATITISALSHALTEASYYNGKEFYEAISIIDIAKANGYKTYWFSNQEIIGFNDTPITLIANACDEMRFTDASEKYDENILPFMSIPKKDAKNFIVIHLYGSHIPYEKRYPKKFQKWSDSEDGDVTAYNNSLAYTDYVLEQIYETAKANYNLGAMIYFSDHASDPTHEAESGEKAFSNLRIPLWIYLSPKYQSEHSEIVQNLKKNKASYFSNDLIYNLICGIILDKSNHFDKQESLTAADYKYDLDNAKTCYGEKMISEDPQLSK